MKVVKELRITNLEERMLENTLIWLGDNAEDLENFGFNAEEAACDIEDILDYANIDYVEPRTEEEVKRDNKKHPLTVKELISILEKMSQHGAVYLVDEKGNPISIVDAYSYSDDQEVALVPDKEEFQKLKGEGERERGIHELRSATEVAQEIEKLAKMWGISEEELL